MRPPVIDVADLRRTYRLGGVEVNALRGIDLRIEAGEFVAIMGASGSGKSTLMHILGCLDRPTSGRYRLEGLDTARMSEAERAAVRSRRIGFVFQSFNLLPRTTAQANVALPLLYAGPRGLDRGECRTRAGEVLEAVGVLAQARHNPNQLSGGQQQRVALARALINDPALLLADEPTGNLDSATSQEVMRVIRGLNRAYELTVVLVTHEPDIAAYADRVITLRDGRIESDVRNDRAILAAQAPRLPSIGPATDTPEAGAGLSLALVRMTFAAAATALARNKLRAALTMLGVFIGVAALIAMIALGTGAHEAVKRQIASLGTSLFVILPGASTANGVRAGNSSASTLTVGDAEAIERETGTVSRVS